MTTSDYPMPTIPSYELYQLAHVATFIADRLARHREALSLGDKPRARDAARDTHLGRQALANATADPTAVAHHLPRPLDVATYRQAEHLVAQHTQRRADVVSLASTGRPSWAVTGFVPGIGPAGAEVATYTTAVAIREHLLTQPAERLTAWRVTDQPLSLDRAATRDRKSLLAHAPRTVATLNPTDPQHIAVAKHLRNQPTALNAAIRDRFHGVNLDTPVPPPLPNDPPPAQTATTTAPAAGAAPAATPEPPAPAPAEATPAPQTPQRPPASNAATPGTAAAAAQTRATLTPAAAASGEPADAHRRVSTHDHSPQRGNTAAAQPPPTRPAPQPTPPPS